MDRAFPTGCWVGACANCAFGLDILAWYGAIAFLLIGAVAFKCCMVACTVLANHCLSESCKVPKTMTIVTLWWAMNKFSCWVEVTLECNVVSDATVSNLGICEVEHYRHMFSGLLVALWVGEEFSPLEH